MEEQSHLRSNAFKMEQVRDGQGQAGTGKNVQLSVHNEAEHELHKTMRALRRGVWDLCYLC